MNDHDILTEMFDQKNKIKSTCSEGTMLKVSSYFVKYLLFEITQNVLRFIKRMGETS